MMRALWTAASGMTSQQTNVDTIANNLSNINTAGYKTEKAEFKSLLYQNLQSQSTNSDGTNKPVSAQVGLGTRMASVTSNFSQGALNETDSFMDWGIEGDGFYKIDTGNKGIMYTRNASFSLSVVDGGAMVTTTDGYPVLDRNNNTIVISDDYTMSSISITQDGKLYAKNKAGENVDLGIQVGLVQFSNPAGLEKNGNSLYRATDNSGEAMEELTSDTLKLSSIRQNYLESSNVNAADEMVNLIVAQRAYEMNSKCISAADTMMQQANNLRG
ncbi:MAG: flagellar hook-basal body complex protein [Lachnospiraceae bacterium]|nr:flagellar hook-basal body complex protein [Lachnospiraceae bacterium]